MVSVTDVPGAVLAALASVHLPIRALAFGVVLALGAGLAHAGTPKRTFSLAAEQEATTWRSIFRRPARLARFAISSGVSVVAGVVTNYLTGSPSAAAFASFTSNVVADRALERVWPGSRVAGEVRPSPTREVVQTLVGGSVAAAAAPYMIHTVQPLSHLGGSAPGLLGLGAQLVLSRPIVQTLGGLGANLLATGARAAVGKIMWLAPTPRSGRLQPGLARSAPSSSLVM